MVIYAYFAKCDPIIMGRIKKTDEYFPFFVVNFLRDYPGVAGLHVSSVYAGSLSTVSSGINAMAMCTIEDFIKPFWSVPDHLYTKLSMALVMFFGVLSIFIAYLASTLGPLLTAALSILGNKLASIELQAFKVFSVVPWWLYLQWVLYFPLQIRKVPSLVPLSVALSVGLCTLGPRPGQRASFY